MGTVEEGLEGIEKGFTGMDFGGDVDHVVGVTIDECMEDIEDSISMAGDEGIGVITKGNGKSSLSFGGFKNAIEELVEEVRFWGDGGELFRMLMPVGILVTDAVGTFEGTTVLGIGKEGVEAEIFDTTGFVGKTEDGKSSDHPLAIDAL
jgi:hypothetical protein